MRIMVLGTRFMLALVDGVLNVAFSSCFICFGRLKKVAVRGCCDNIGIRTEPPLNRRYVGGNHRILYA